ncbi:jg26340 [Pararge aegeria aegeria]|uniref:Jg26340 protein n=1 Tax=Pararge aegeria aegeria TaxID=348720 RepID=A0A8S4QW10_9NEOP|nr:jg26340 [Pararge aegeria aegeria]
MNGVCLNSLSYADDMVILSPSIKGLRKLLSVCEHYANAHGLKNNVDKTEMLIFKACKGPDRTPGIILNGKAVRVVQKFKYLGHVLTEHLKDNSDIEREGRALSIRCNMLARRFGKCSKEVKITLFNAYCQCFYTCQLWTNFFKKSFSAIRVQYNDAFRILMGLPRYCSASTMFAESGVPNFYCIVRARVASFWERIRNSNNGILRVVCEGMPRPISDYWLSVHRYWNKK